MTRRRIHWYSFQVQRGSLRRLADGIGRELYTPKNGHGFVVGEVRATEMAGRHIERREDELVSIDPYGMEVRQRVTAFRVTAFRVSVEPPGLELIDPPRSTSMALSQLASHVGFASAISAVTVDPLVWLENIESGGARAVVRRLDYSDISFSGGTIGALTLRGELDVRGAGRRILGDRVRTVRRVVGEVAGANGLPASIYVLENNGRASIAAHEVDVDTRMVRTALVRAALAHA